MGLCFTDLKLIGNIQALSPKQYPHTHTNMCIHIHKLFENSHLKGSVFNLLCSQTTKPKRYSLFSTVLMQRCSWLY